MKKILWALAAVAVVVGCEGNGNTAEREAK
jgi:hypothetical protein